MIKHYINTFLYAIMGGICIALGGTAYLCTENNILGSILFTVGLFTICTMGFNLYTGKVADVPLNKPSYIIDVIFVWLGNLCGAWLTAFVLSFTRISDKMVEKATVCCNTKLTDNLLSVFILGIFCNLLIFIAIDGYKNNPHSVGKYLGLLFGVVAFIFCGFEHSVADMFYFSVGNAWSGKTLLWLAVISLGNAVGGMLIPVIRIVHKKLVGKTEDK